MKRALLVAVLAGGCGVGPGAMDPVDPEVLDRLWVEVYGMSGPAPRVEWVYPERFNCDDGIAPWGWLDEAGRCVQGQALSSTRVRVGVKPERLISDWFIAHEFSHARDFALGGDGDFWHKGQGFGRGSFQQRAQDWLDAEFGTQREHPEWVP